MQDSLSNLVDNLSNINNKKPKDNMRSMIYLLLHPVIKISEINKKIPQIDKEKLKNKITDNMRSMIDPLLHLVNKISEINKKIAQID